MLSLLIQIKQMLIPLPKLIRKYSMNIKGVIHIGAHFGEETANYMRAGISNICLVEPAYAAFHRLKLKYQHKKHIRLFNVALGASEGMVPMYVETANAGQSNSLLKPKLHLEEYPSIPFNSTEDVQCVTLDSLMIDDCNFINMDVQGYELEVLKGAMQTLKNIQYIYCEVNFKELYENCVLIDELDEFLKQYNFERVITQKQSDSWGDALYIKKQKLTNLSYVDVQVDFRPRIRINYPPNNQQIFEEYFSRSLTGKESIKRKYLPVHWTSYYVNNGYGKDRTKIARLQRFLNTLPIGEKYFTIQQYDDGILNDLRNLDIKVFSSSGHGIDIPLLSQPLPYKFESTKKYLFNFIGRHTHHLRNDIFNIKRDDVYISDKPHSQEDYARIISQSYFTLCPRGYGINSFRIQEAIQYHSIPVYISDRFCMPINFSEYGICVNNVSEVQDAINKMKDVQIDFEEVFNKYFSYESVKNYILNHHENN